MTIAITVVVLLVVVAVGWRLSWAARNLPFAAVALVLGVVYGSVLLIGCALAIALLSALMMVMRRNSGRPMWRDEPS